MSRCQAPSCRCVTPCRSWEVECWERGDEDLDPEYELALERQREEREAEQVAAVGEAA